MKRKMLMSDRNVAWIEHFCRRPSGLRKGDRVLLTEEQFKQIEQVYDTPTGAYDPVKLKLNGVKGELALSLALAHLAGPLMGKQFGDVFFADIDTLWEAASPELQQLLQRQAKRLFVPVDEGPQAA
jgi:hypothetical protein